MDLAQRKLAFLHQVLEIDNTDVIYKLEQILSSHESTTANLHPMSIEELFARITDAENAASSGRIKDSQALRNQINEW